MTFFKYTYFTPEDPLRLLSRKVFNVSFSRKKYFYANYSENEWNSQSKYLWRNCDNICFLYTL